MGRLIFLTYFYLIASLIHIVLIGLIQFIDTKVAIIGEIWKSRAKLLRNRLFEKIASVTG
jgi:hypothetical protein